MNRKIRVMLLCFLLAVATVFVACEEDGEELLPKATTATTERTEVTTAATTSTVTASNLVPTIEEGDYNNSHRILGRLNPPITVNIDDTTTIDLDYQGWPTICKGENGKLYAVSSARKEHICPFGALVFYESNDNGETWTQARIIKDTPLDDRDAGITYLGNNCLLVSWFTQQAENYFDGGSLDSWLNSKRITADQKDAATERLEDLSTMDRRGGSYVMLSRDGGATWEEPVRLPLLAPHGATLSQDGKTLYFFGQSYHVSYTEWNGQLKNGNYYIFSSKDMGKTWRQMAALPLPAWSESDKSYGGDFSEPYVIQLKDGSFVAALRREFDPDGPNKEGQLSMSAMTIYTATSKDGRSWTPLKRISSDMKGGPPHMLQLDNGVVLLTYSYRVSPACGIRYRLSYDGGVTWSRERILCVSYTPKNYDLGYPSTVQLDDGSLITAYYMAYRGDDYNSFLFTKWKLTEDK